MRSLTLLAVVIAAAIAQGQYRVSVASIEPDPVLSYLKGSSAFQQVFNPAWVEGRTPGLLVRTQNCTATVGGSCPHCGGDATKASIITFARLAAGGDAQRPPQFAPVGADSVVFGPHDDTDSWGTEDPRLAMDPKTGVYYLFYTAYNGKSILLNLASTQDPTRKDGWTRHGPVFPSIQGSKSGALLIRDQPPHYLFWGDSSIRVTKSNNLTSWPDPGEVILAPRQDSFDSQLVESGPPPLRLSNGNYIFFHNSADKTTAYHASWAILDGNDPTKVLARATEPLLSPDLAWERGVSPWTCNVANVVFLEAAAEVGKDTFRVYFGGSDAVIGTAVITVAFN
eukprot:TRINITY_DN460_c0_g1_i1.p1 TRINITY_DN460_c0_g1~~TRINITY_DN460_c0_g1_i1.p1  ORF type:complete len:339 (-),score=54.16 TRINITY_DN460_c0_g1_i1:21-1037(-)